MLDEAGCQAVFVPTSEDVYENKVASDQFDFEGLDKVMEGLFRKGHFDGVATIVKKLFQLIEPDRAYFGEKDYQQLLIIKKMVSLENIPVEIVPGPRALVRADGDQLDQVLINLIDNAVDAAAETGGGVRVGWSADRRQVDVWVEDDGPGIADTGNLFVPFYTTKADGSGIGLVLSRQIAEAHQGTLTLVNRETAGGCVAQLSLPAAS